MVASSASAAAPRAPAASRNSGAPRLFSRGMLKPVAIAPVLAVVCAVAPSAAAGTVSLAPLPASVKLSDCSRETHSATFQGRMKRVEGAERMWMRFTLLEKHASGFEAVSAPGLGRWHKSKPGVGTFNYLQTVRGLQQGASYRMAVSYRWYDAEREAIAKTRRRSAPCHQFAALPNLTAALAEVQETKDEGVVRYAVRVANEGVAAANAVAVRLTVDGAVVDTVTLASLRVDESRLLTFRGPECRVSVTAAADPGRPSGAPISPCAGGTAGVCPWGRALLLLPPRRRRVRRL